MREIIAELGGLLELVLLFGVLAVVGLIGVGFRRYYEYARHGNAKRGCFTLFLSLIGLVAVVIVGLLLASKGSSTLCMSGYVIGVIVLLLLGWSGVLLVPEGLGDD